MQRSQIGKELEIPDTRCPEPGMGYLVRKVWVQMGRSRGGEGTYQKVDPGVPEADIRDPTVRSYEGTEGTGQTWKRGLPQLLVAPLLPHTIWTEECPFL